LIAVNDSYLIDRELDFHGKPEFPAFPHVRKFGRSRRLPNQIGTLEVDSAQLHLEAALILRTIDTILKRGWIDVTARLSDAVAGNVPVHVDEKASRYLTGNPTILESASRVASILGGLVHTYGLAELDVRSLYDIELERTKIVLSLTAEPSDQISVFDRETQILSNLAERLSDDDKLRIAVRVK
jgi:hypothetical protein